MISQTIETVKDNRETVKSAAKDFKISRSILRHNLDINKGVELIAKQGQKSGGDKLHYLNKTKRI